MSRSILTFTAYRYWPIGLNSNNLSASDFRMYPNPAKDEVRIEWFNYRSEDVELVIRDLSGRVVMKKNI